MVLRKYLKSGSPLKRCLFKLIEEIDYRLADTVLTVCEYMISENNLQKYKSRVVSLFVDTNKFTDRISFHNRRYEIGFVGRLDRAKGILNFLKALEALNGNPNVIIIGDGEEKNSVLSKIQILKSTNKLDVTYIDWIENAKLPNYLNEIKVVVVPSYKEGLPNVVLESMACGCVVLATPVGGIPAVIKDEQTGFIMEDNCPACIARNVIRALSHPNLGKIVRNARALIEQECTFKRAVKRYRNILASLK
ncbi:D-inositol-3-phosphate glycosyltransferase [subsurface metagenome]